MLTTETFSNCLERLFPCTGLIYVGAGNGYTFTGDRFRHISRLLAIEADDQTFLHLTSTLQAHDNWKPLKALVSDTEDDVPFFEASNPNESCLLDPEELKKVWRNLVCREVRLMTPTTLSTILQNDENAKAYNWLSIACLPSAKILRGLEGQFEQFDVINVRVLDQAAGILERGSTKPECDALLLPIGYKVAFIEEAANPLVQNVTYVRDMRIYLKIQAEYMAKQHQLQNDQLIKSKKTAEALSAEYAQKTQQAMQAKAVAEQQATERQVKIGNLESRVKQLQEADAKHKLQQQILQEQLSSAEAQLELLKTLLLNEISL